MKMKRYQKKSCVKTEKKDHSKQIREPTEFKHIIKWRKRK